jgi:hypothetical protein
MAFAGARIGALLRGLSNRPSVEAGLRAVRPEGVMGWGMELAPDVLGTIGLVSSMQGADPTEQWGGGALDLATGLGLSFGSRALFGMAGHRLNRGRRGITPEALHGITNTAGNIGGFLVPTAAYMTMGTENMNPFYRGYVDRMQQEGEAAQREREEGLIAQALANAGSNPRIGGLDYLMSGNYGS